MKTLLLAACYAVMACVILTGVVKLVKRDEHI